MDKHYFVSYVFNKTDGQAAIANGVVDCKKIKTVKDIDNVIALLEKEGVKKYGLMKGSVNILSLSRL